MSDTAASPPPIDYDRWYPDVPPVMTSTDLAELLRTSDQIVRGWARDGLIPYQRPDGRRRMYFLRHEIFEWLNSTRVDPTQTDTEDQST